MAIRKCAHCGKLSATVLSTRVWGFPVAVCSMCFEVLMKLLSDFTPHRESKMYRVTTVAGRLR